ncbi:signal peptidase I [Sandaracinobacter sp. RS1-74]|uniref:signal peptidase I n=1 Tax=Sandaracinobacteroides sayramensis TaxID=2913411 RepID=UPI001EDC0D82|nr:signal peptidase I [Sandaracinobacteroides sayramensis]MCG2839669.1 signal peptidase I [Sandaracinobacteroides sayramensis]
MNASAPDLSKPSSPPKEPFSWGRELKQWAMLILIVLGVHSFVAKPFYIPSESMMANLLVGDRLIVSKFPYGFSYLSPSVPILPHIPGRLFGSMPEQGDIIVIKSPSDGADWIKRVIGLPGDTVEMRDGELWLNGKRLPRERRPETELLVTPNTDCPYMPQFRGMGADGLPVCRFPTYRETLSNGRQYDTLDMALTERDNFGPVTVPEGHLFLMGDNRDNSMDSRVPPEIGGLGLVPWENIVGRAEFTTFSLDGSQTINPLTWWGALRGDRAFLSLRN